MPHQHGIEHGEVVPLEVVLTEHGEAFARAQGHAALGRFEFARNGLQEGGLSGTVRTDDTINITVGELHVHVLVQHSFAELDGEIGNCYHDLCLNLIDFRGAKIRISARYFKGFRGFD